MTRTLAVCTLLTLLLAAGCAAPQSVGGYFADRGRDFAESFRLSAGPGVGLHARVNAIVLFAGEGFSRAEKYGWDGAGGVRGPHWSKLAVTVWIPILFGYDSDVRGLDEGAPWRYFLKPHFDDPRPLAFAAEVAHLSGHLMLTGYDWRYHRRGIRRGTDLADRSWIEVDATAAVLSVRAGFNPAEFFDFLIGLGCLDILGDDRHTLQEAEKGTVPFLLPER